VPLLVNELGPLVAEYQDGLDLVSDLAETVDRIVEALAGVAEGIQNAWNSGTIDVGILAMLLRQFGAGLSEIQRFGVPTGYTMANPPALPTVPAGENGAGTTWGQGPAKEETVFILNLKVNGKQKAQYPVKMGESKEVSIDIGQDQAVSP